MGYKVVLYCIVTKYKKKTPSDFRNCPIIECGPKLALPSEIRKNRCIPLIFFYNLLRLYDQVFLKTKCASKRQAPYKTSLTFEKSDFNDNVDSQL